jgi:hypothetical protein
MEIRTTRRRGAGRTTARAALALVRTVARLVLVLVFLVPSVLLLCSPASGDVSVWLYPDTLCTGPSETLKLYLWIDEQSGGFSGYEGVVRFDPSVLEFVAVQEESLMTNLCHNTWWQPAVGDSTIFFSHVTLCSGLTVTGPGALSSITFQGPAVAQTTPVTFDYIYFSYAGYPDSAVTAHDGLIVVSPDCPAQGSCCLSDGSCLVALPDECSDLGGRFLEFLEDCTPNPCLAMGLNEPPLQEAGPRLEIVPCPAAKDMFLDYRLRFPGPVRIEILDANGRLVRTLLNGPVGGRQGSVRWGGDNDRGACVPPGVYFARILAGGEASARRVVYIE